VALTLVAPTGPVTTLASGIIVVRCEDYVAGGATTVADADSVSGTVVSETQTAAVQTTFVSQGTLYGGRADTISVPQADLGLDADALNYRVFIAARLLGDVPSNAKGRATWEKFDRGGASVGFGWGKNTGFEDGPLAVAQSRFEEYLIYPCGQLSGFTFTDFKVRGWGITGGTVEWRFDLIYLVPFILGPDFNDTIENSGRFNLPLQFDSNGALFFDNDQNVSTWIGAHTVMAYDFPWMDTGADDVQEDDNEPTVMLQGFGDWTDEPAPRSYLAMIVGGTKPPDAETILDDTFPYPDTVGQVDASQFWIINGYYSGFGPNSIDNSYFDGVSIWRGWVIRSGLPTCWIGPNESSVLPLYDGEAEILWGFDDGSGSADPRDYSERLDLREGVFSGLFRFDTLQEAYGMVGLHSTNQSMRAGGVIELDSSGNVKVSVRLIWRISPGLEEIMDEATVITGVTTSDQIWVKAERRGDRWRAKAWLDGTTEPGWQVEGVEPIVASGGGTYSLVSYPWNVNWVGDPDHDTVEYDPRLRTSPTGFDLYFPAAVAAVGTGLAQMKIDLFEMIVEFDPGTGTPGDMTVQTRRTDLTTVLDAAVVVPYGSHRFVAGPLKQRHFDTDTETFDVWAWKSGGGPDTMFASVGYIWELRPHIAAVIGFIKGGPRLYGVV